jgi:L-amino acid N-acyltransferase YncA
VSDLYQEQGLGTELLRRLIEVARQEKLQEIIAHILLENLASVSWPTASVSNFVKVMTPK